MSDRHKDAVLLLAVLLAVFADFLAPEPSAGFNPVPAAAALALTAVGVWRWWHVFQPPDAAGVWEGEADVSGAAAPAAVTLDLEQEGRRLSCTVRLPGTLGHAHLPVSPESEVAPRLAGDGVLVVAHGGAPEDERRPTVVVYGRVSGSRMRARLWADGAWVDYDAERIGARREDGS